MDENVKAAWQSFKNVSQNFLGNTKSENYENIVNELLENYKNIGCSMSLKLHFLHSHLEYFPQNLGDYSEEQGWTWWTISSWHKGNGESISGKIGCQHDGRFLLDATERHKNGQQKEKEKSIA